MLRLNILLLTIVVATALGTVAANHRARNLVTAFEKEQGETQRLNVEWGQLQLERQSTFPIVGHRGHLRQNRLSA